MNFLKSIPLTYEGELHQVRLVNFWVDYEEVASLVPAPLVAKKFGDKALISSVNVSLEKMHASFLPAIEFGYRHIAFRLVLEDRASDTDQSKAIFFLRSFSDRKDVVTWGNMLTDYNLELAEIQNIDPMLGLRSGDRYFNYALDLSRTGPPDEAQHKIVSSLDRAYSVDGNDLKMVKIAREKWPIRQVQCYLLETNFFKSAKPASAFVVDETIPYRWLAPEILASCEEFEKMVKTVK
jgi:hypothetical protein